MNDLQTVVVPTNNKTIVFSVDEQRSIVVARSIVNVGAGSGSGDFNPTNYYTNTQTDTLLAAKANLIHYHVIDDITDFDGTIMAGGTF